MCFPITTTVSLRKSMPGSPASALDREPVYHNTQTLQGSGKRPDDPEETFTNKVRAYERHIQTDRDRTHSSGGCETTTLPKESTAALRSFLHRKFSIRRRNLSSTHSLLVSNCKFPWCYWPWTEPWGHMLTGVCLKLRRTNSHLFTANKKKGKYFDWKCS